MALSITPTLTAQRWGQKSCELFDYYAHGTRDAGGNPLVIFRHSGGSSYQDDWTTDREPGNIFDFLHSTADLDLHFDILSIETPARSLASTVANGNRLLMTSAIRELQRAIAEVKRLGVIGFGTSNQYKINPHRVVGYGFSVSGGMMMLSQFLPAYQGSSNSSTFSPAPYRGESFDSSVQLLIINAAQVDIRTIASVDQVHYSQLGSYFGTCTTSSGEWDALPERMKDSLSCLAYLENGDFAACPPVAVLYNNAGDHAHPYGSGVGSSDVHDSQQGLDLVAALQAAGIRYLNMQYPVTDTTRGWLNGTVGKTTNCNALYNFISPVIRAVG